MGFPWRTDRVELTSAASNGESSRDRMVKVLAKVPSAVCGTSLTNAFEIACLAHLLICIAFVTSCSSAKPLDLGGAKITPLLQCLNATWCLVGVPLIILAGVSAIYRMATYLTLYFLYLVATLVMTLVWLFAFLKIGFVCETTQPILQSISPPTPTTGIAYSPNGATFSCGMIDGVIVMFLALLVGFLCFSIYLVWAVNAQVVKRCGLELMRYREPWQSETLAGESMPVARQVQSGAIF